MPLALLAQSIPARNRSTHLSAKENAGKADFHQGQIAIPIELVTRITVHPAQRWVAFQTLGDYDQRAWKRTTEGCAAGPLDSGTQGSYRCHDGSAFT
ncbi:hypothetical protein [Singulisphaera acidiphila]|uniref:hypothetical protein n=1 Tax=Singulisphaera acidiphila TaxID=466153 RepID=UPI00036D95BB|nr:hypothetical protein [Singulisphaera acidiphila]